jgi:hypothetical protein
MSQIEYFNFINQKNFTYQIAREKFLTNQNVFYFQKNHFLREIFDDKIDRFRESGIIDQLGKNYVDFRGFYKKNNEKVNKPITLKTISGVLGVSFCGLLIATVIFLIELTRKKI